MEMIMAQPNRFWDRHAEGYAKRPVADEAAYRRKLELTQEYLQPHMQVLEFGCGTGTTALIHAPFVKHIRAVDISKNMLQIARAKAKAEKVDNVTFERSSIEELRADDATYDVVMGHSILHLLEDKEAAIAKVHGLLKPGGQFVSSTVCISGAMRLLQVVLPIGRFFGLLPLVRFFTANALAGCLEEAGFRIDHRWQPDNSKAVFIIATKV